MTSAIAAEVAYAHPLEQAEYLRGDVREPIAGLPLARRLNLLLLMRRNPQAVADTFRRDLRRAGRHCPPIDDPAEWLVTLPLYRALAGALPRGVRDLVALDERARHAPACPAHTLGQDCGCTPHPPTPRAELAALAVGAVRR